MQNIHVETAKMTYLQTFNTRNREKEKEKKKEIFIKLVKQIYFDTSVMSASLAINIHSYQLVK